MILFFPRLHIQVNFFHLIFFITCSLLAVTVYTVIGFTAILNILNRALTFEKKSRKIFFKNDN
jgi:uncharacterized membrane protein YuzA (DUF378 family)